MKQRNLQSLISVIVIFNIRREYMGRMDVWVSRPSKDQRARDPRTARFSE